jgi:hypothetical protein
VDFAEPGWFGVVTADEAAFLYAVAYGLAVKLFALQWWFGFRDGGRIPDGFVAGIAFPGGRCWRARVAFHVSSK